MSRACWSTCMIAIMETTSASGPVMPPAERIGWLSSDSSACSKAAIVVARFFSNSSISSADAHLRPLLHLALVVIVDAATRGAECGLCGALLRRFRRLRRLRLARHLDQAGIGPLDGGDVGEDLAAVPAALVAALLEAFRRHGAELQTTSSPLVRSLSSSSCFGRWHG